MISISSILVTELKLTAIRNKHASLMRHVLSPSLSRQVYFIGFYFILLFSLTLDSLAEKSGKHSFHIVPMFVPLKKTLQLLFVR